MRGRMAWLGYDASKAIFLGSLLRQGSIGTPEPYPSDPCPTRPFLGHSDTQNS